jgi:hypothetical protein
LTAGTLPGDDQGLLTARARNVQRQFDDAWLGLYFDSICRRRLCAIGPACNADLALSTGLWTAKEDRS